ncbi:NAD(P)-binding protein [Mytilinidion resinicola]|uniref:NAD(P)-binding protein n=1 Tax=Mytilinidion resinicola TaxID=574789 RepID=A0A6A6YTP1_9PEZI|nr:NAD(P)-binding protein [Mytilinidion resinicola]KAF2811743.1 NAD(P)-binding protein [Mytilinidion resinicola]
MVHIAIAGGSGEVASEVIDALVAAKKHEITILSRRGLIWRTVNYDDKSELAEALQGIHTVLSFIQLMTDPNQQAQKNLIDAAILADVKRFAPSEYGSSTTVDMPWWARKDATQEYLKQVNESGKTIEYTLFQPGMFLDYLAFPYKTAKHLTPLNTMIDFENRRAVVVEGHDAIMTFTTVQDLAAVVARAVDYDGKWPVIGGISGNRIPVSRILEIGERVRGHPFVIEKVKLEDLERGNLKTSWSLETSHPSVSGEQATSLLKAVLIGILLSGAKGAWDVSDEYNQLLPDYKFTQIDDFLAEVWKGKP